MSLTIVTASLKSIAPYSQSKHYRKELQQGESNDDHYRRTWRNHMHFDEKGQVFIPPSAFKNALSEAAKFLSIKVPGGGKATYTKHFEAGVLVVKPVFLGIHKDKVECENLFLPADGRRGSGTRIEKYYPFIPEWKAEVEFLISDETVLQSSVQDKNRTVFEIVLEASGTLIGLGRFRPRNNGWYGRFSVEEVEISRMAEAA
jgi:hypothetical protein